MDETLESAASRELEEETGLTNIELTQFKAYSEVNRDPRGRTISMVFTGEASNIQEVKAGDDAKKVKWFNIQNLPELAFDHKQIMIEFFSF